MALALNHSRRGYAEYWRALALINADGKVCATQAIMRLNIRK